MKDKKIFSAVRCNNIKSYHQLVALEKHAKRLDENSKNRVDFNRTKNNLYYSQYCEDATNLTQCHKEFKKFTGSVERKNSSLGLHFLAVISPEFIEETGDIHDPKNPRNVEIFNQSQEWIKQEFGEDSLISARMDLDEKGGGVVDLFVVPTKQITTKHTSKKTISTRQALKDIQYKYNRKKSFEALQDSFSLFCQNNIDEKISRGIPKEISQREHVHADIYREEIETIKKKIRNTKELNKKLTEKNKKLEKIVKPINKISSVITEAYLTVSKKEYDKAFAYNEKITEKKIKEKDREINKRNKRISALKSEIDVKQNTINSQQKQLTNTILENTKLNNDYEKINDKLKEKDKILSVIRDYLKNVKDVPKHVLTALQLSTRSEAEQSAGRQFKGLKGP